MGCWEVTIQRREIKSRGCLQNGDWGGSSSEEPCSVLVHSWGGGVLAAEGLHFFSYLDEKMSIETHISRRTCSTSSELILQYPNPSQCPSYDQEYRGVPAECLGLDQNALRGLVKDWMDRIPRH